MENLTWQFLHQLSKYLPAVEGIHYLAVSTSPLGLCAGCLMENITWQFLHPLHRGTNTNCSQRDHSVTTSFEQLVHLFRQTEQKTKTKNTVSSNWFVCSGKLTPQKQKNNKNNIVSSNWFVWSNKLTKQQQQQKPNQLNELTKKPQFQATGLSAETNWQKKNNYSFKQLVCRLR